MARDDIAFGYAGMAPDPALLDELAPARKKLPKVPKLRTPKEVPGGAWQDFAFGYAGMAPEASTIDDEALLPTPAASAGQSTLPAGAAQLTAPTAAPALTEDQQYAEHLRTQQARPMPRNTFRRRAKDPLRGIQMPQLPPNASFGDLMKFRMDAIRTGTQLVPRVAEAAQRRTEREQAMDTAQLGLKEVELGQRQIAGQADRALKLRGQENVLEAARIRAAGSDGSGMVGAMKQIKAGQQFEDLLPVSAPDLQGNTTAAVSRKLADVYPADAVLRVVRQLQEQAAQSGEVNLESPENAQAFNTRLAQTLNQMYPGKLPQVPQ